MNKRRKKKKVKKTLPLIAEKAHLFMLSEAERQFAIKQAEKYRLKYGYRKKYSNLKRKKFILYSYVTGKEINMESAYIEWDVIARTSKHVNVKIY